MPTATSGIIDWFNANAGAVTALATLALTIVTGVFVWITKSSAVRQEEATKRQTTLSEAELFRNLMTEYSQQEMSAALIQLEQWERDHGASLTAEAGAWAERFNLQRGVEGDPQRVSDVAVNDARRRVALFYRKLSVFIEQEYFSAPLLAEFKKFASRHMVLGVVRELDIAHAKAQHRPKGVEEARDIYDRLQRVFGDA